MTIKGSSHNLCWICNKTTTDKYVKLRCGNRAILHCCKICNFHFFSKDYSHLITSNQFDQNRLKKAGLEIPEFKKDFENGLSQSRDYIDKFITNKDKGKSVLEIGCSWGYFLKLLEEKKIRPYGVELNPIRAAYVQNNLDIPCFQHLSEVKEKKLTFDKIFLFYVIEYISDPIDYFRNLLELLKNGSSIYIITPNHDDVLKDIWKNEGFKNFFYEKMAVSYYSAKAVKELLSVIKKTVDQITYKIETEQGYSFFNHLSWYFTNKPMPTGIVAGDDYCLDIVKRLRNPNLKLGVELSELIKGFDRKYKEIIKSYNYGNRIIVKIKKNKRS